MITSRQQRILNQLMEALDYIPLKQLTEQYEISDRTLRHDLLQLEDWLREHDVVLERHRSNGVKLRHDLEQLRKIEQQLNYRQVIMDSKQRMNVLLKLLLQQSTLSMEQVMEDFVISHSTLLVDLHEIKLWLDSRKLKLVKSKGMLSVDGKEGAKRSAYLELLRAEITEDRLLKYMFDQNDEAGNKLSFLNKWFKAEDVQIIFDLLQQIEKLLNMQFADAGYTTITLHLLMATQRLKQEHTITMDSKLLKELEKTEVFRIISSDIVPQINGHFQVTLPVSEIGYITQHVLGAQKQHIESKDTAYIPLAKDIVSRTEAALGYRLQMSEQAIKGLAIHLKPAIYRAKFNLQLRNPLMEQLEEQYGSLLKLLEKLVNEAIAELNITFDRDEIGYIMLHIASGIVPHVLNTSKRVAIVCASGIGTSAIIKRRLAFIFPQLDVVKICSYKESALLTGKDADAVLTTINIGHSLPIPWLKVSPLLTEQDQQKISQFFQISSKEDTAAETIQTVNDIMKIIERNAIVEHRSRLLEELLQMLQGASVPPSKELSLTDLLPASSISLLQDPLQWEDAIRFGNGFLIAQGSSNERYEEKLIEMIQSGNHSFLISNGIYFPHAYMPEDVTQTMFSLVTFQEPVLFGPSKHPVWLMITLAAVDKEGHIGPLSTLLNALNDNEFVARLKTSADRLQIWQLLREKEGL